jgi:hypothetical protein
VRLWRGGKPKWKARVWQAPGEGASGRGGGTDLKEDLSDFQFVTNVVMDREALSLNEKLASWAPLRGEGAAADPARRPGLSGLRTQLVVMNLKWF